ncbi:phage portal protein [Azospirillum sp. TSH58]|uniref:phage portal protein n=2 Tax=Azospirillum sp. TSH58 TaxID=664962 RepID=UPI0013A5967A|nr:phage portal protein [Azospirillum sp. TSH58]
MFDAHPGDRSAMAASRRMDSKPVPASDIAHLFAMERIGQARGVPWLCAVLLAISELGDYRLAEQTRKKLEASVAAFILPGAGDDDDNNGRPSGLTGTATEQPGAYDAHNQLLETIEPGTIATLRNGRDIRFNTPSHNQSYPDYIRAELQQIASGALMTYELLTGDLSNTNYSSIRAGRNDFRAMIEQLQWAFFIPFQLDPLWRWYVDGMFVAGRIREKNYGVEWDTPRFISIDPYKDALADLIEMRAGLKSPIAAIGERGYHWKSVLAEFRAYFDAVDGEGLVFDSDARKVTKSGSANNLTPQQMDAAADRILRALEADGDPDAPRLRALYQAAVNS